MSFTVKLKQILIVGCVGLMIDLPFAGFGQSWTVASDTLGTSHLAAPVRKRVYQKLEEELESVEGLTRSVLDRFPLIMIVLSPDGKTGIRISGTNKEGPPLICGATGNCEIWVFDQKTGDLLLSANGFDVLVQTSVHHGLFDIVTRHNMGAGSGVRDLYQFDGHEYQNVQETNETYQ
jgi:hypothetical protein